MREISAFQIQQRQLDFASVKRACPKGIYLAPSPKDPNVWQGVLFVRKGPYAPAILKFKISLPVSPRPPVIAISTDIFHPLVTPLTTYTYTNSDTGTDTVSATDEDRLPPGGFSLRHGFPGWFGLSKVSLEAEEAHTTAQDDPSPNASLSSGNDNTSGTSKRDERVVSGRSQVYCGAVEIARVLYYMRSAFDSEVLLDKVPLEAAGNPGAWHAWQAHRAKTSAPTSSAVSSEQNQGLSANLLRQQPGGARRPGQWNWEGVWEERVKKGIHASISQHAIYSSGQDSDLINFIDIDPALIKQTDAWKRSNELMPDSASTPA